MFVCWIFNQQTKQTKHHNDYSVTNNNIDFNMENIISFQFNKIILDNTFFQAYFFMYFFFSNVFFSNLKKYFILIFGIFMSMFFIIFIPICLFVCCYCVTLTIFSSKIDSMEQFFMHQNLELFYYVFCVLLIHIVVEIKSIL